MTASRSFDELLDSFLEGPYAELPDRVFDAVRDEIHHTHQRRLPWRFPEMSNAARVAIAAAAAIAIAIAGLSLIRFPTGPGGLPSPTPTGTPMPIPRYEALDPARYVFDWRYAAGNDGAGIGPSIAITIPSDGWTTWDRFAVDKNNGETPGVSFVVWKIVGRYVDACLDHSAMSPLAGPTVNDLIVTLSGQPGIVTGEPVDVVIDGYAGQSLDLTAATPMATCSSGLFKPFIGKHIQADGETNRVYALDVDGFRLTFFLRIPKSTTQANLDLLQSVVDSVDIQP